MNTWPMITARIEVSGELCFQVTSEGPQLRIGCLCDFFLYLVFLVGCLFLVFIDLLLVSVVLVGRWLVPRWSPWIMLWYKCWRWKRSPLCLGHLAISPGCGAGRSWRSYWQSSAPARVAGRWWSAFPSKGACSPWRWRRASGVGGPWTPGGISSGSCSGLC